MQTDKNFKRSNTQSPINNFKADDLNQQSSHQLLMDGHQDRLGVIVHN